MNTLRLIIIAAILLQASFVVSETEGEQDCSVNPCTPQAQYRWVDPQFYGSGITNIQPQAKIITPMEEQVKSQPHSSIIVNGALSQPELDRDGGTTKVLQIPIEAGGPNEIGLAPVENTSERPALILGEDVCCESTVCPGPCPQAAPDLPPATAVHSCCGQPGCPGPQSCPVIPQKDCCDPSSCPMPFPPSCFPSMGERIVPFAHMMEPSATLSFGPHNSIGSIIRQIVADSRDNNKGGSSSSSSSSSSSTDVKRMQEEKKLIQEIHRSKDEFRKQRQRLLKEKLQHNDVFDQLKKQLDSVEKDRANLSKLMQETQARLSVLRGGKPGQSLDLSLPVGKLADQALKMNIGSLESPKTAVEMKKAEIKREMAVIVQKLMSLHSNITKSIEVREMEMRLTVHRLIALQNEKVAIDKQLRRPVDGLEKAEQLDLIGLKKKLDRLAQPNLSETSKQALRVGIKAYMNRLQKLIKEELRG